MKILFFTLFLALFFPSFLYGGISNDSFIEKISIPINGGYLIEESTIELCATDKKSELQRNVCEIEKFKFFMENINPNDFYNKIHFFHSKTELDNILTNKFFSNTLMNHNAWDFENFDYAFLLVNYVSTQFISQQRLVSKENIFTFYYEIWSSNSEKECPCLWAQLFVIKLKKNITNKVRLCERSEPQSEPCVGRARSPYNIENSFFGRSALFRF